MILSWLPHCNSSVTALLALRSTFTDNPGAPSLLGELFGGGEKRERHEDSVCSVASPFFRCIRRGRVHPAKPKVGIRAACPNEIWHVDITVIRLLNGSRVYLQAVIDNFSRRILAWKVSGTFDPTATAGLLIDASKGLLGEKPTLLTDGGGENHNSAVDELIDSGLLTRLLAMTEITYSNSMIESWWRALKHQ